MLEKAAIHVVHPYEKEQSFVSALFRDSWCCGKQINSVHAPTEFNSGKAYRTLNVYRSAISGTHARSDFVSVGEHPLVVQLLKGAYNMTPPLPRYSSMWDVGVVLSFVESLGENDHDA